MFYVLVAEDGTTTYPYTITDFKLANPNVSMRDHPEPEGLAHHGLYPVEPGDQPACDPITQDAVRSARCVDGAWHEVWAVVEADPAIVAARTADRKRALWERVKSRRDAIIDGSFGAKAEAANARATELGAAIAAGEDVDIEAGWP